MNERKSEQRNVVSVNVDVDESGNIVRLPTNIPESQPVDEGGAAERIKVVIRAATSDDWIGVAYQKDYTGDPSTIHEYIRAPSPDSIREKARQVALKLKRDADDMFAMPVDDEPVVTQWADIIAAEFGAGGNSR